MINISKLLQNQKRSILLRKVPMFNRYIMYAPRGFICDIYDKQTLKELTEKAKEAVLLL